MGFLFDKTLTKHAIDKKTRSKRRHIRRKSSQPSDSKEFTGISLHRIQRELPNSKVYERQYAIHQKAPLKSIVAKNVSDRWQIDFINMKSKPVLCHG